MNNPLKILALAAAAFLLCATLSAAPLVFTASLSGPAEAPPNSSPGTGFATVTYDGGGHTLGINLSFSGLIGNTSAAHLHAPTPLAFSGTASVATQTPSFSGFPLGVTAGSYSQVFDLTSALSFRAGYITANGGTAGTAEAALITAMLDGKSYLNIHSSVYPGGEIRGFLVVAPTVPDSSATLILLVPALVGLAAIGRYRRQR